MSELGYLFYYLPNKSKTKSQNNSQKIITPAELSESSKTIQSSFLFDERSAQINGDLVKKIVNEADRNKIVPTSHLDVLISLAKVPNPETGRKDSDLITGNNFQVKNPRETWKVKDDIKSPVIFPGSILIKVLFDNEASPSGIVLTGSSPQDVIKRSIFFGIGDNGKHLNIEVQTKRPEPYVVFDKTFNKKLEGIYILFNKKGTSFLVTDLSINKIVSIDVKDQVSSRLAEGLFPKDLFYLGYVVSPKSKLVISELSFLLTK